MGWTLPKVCFICQRLMKSHSAPGDLERLIRCNKGFLGREGQALEYVQKYLERVGKKLPWLYSDGVVVVGPDC